VAPPIRYVRSGDVSIAYQVVGDAPIDILMLPGRISHLSLDWEEPTWVRWAERLTSFARIIRFDKRGTGLSDRPAGVPTLEERMRDALAVMDAVGLGRPHVVGWSEGGPLGVLLAVTYPERVQSLILYGTQSCFRLTDDYPWGIPAATIEESVARIEKEWGQLAFARRYAPHGDDRFAGQWAAYQRAGASPSAAAALRKANSEIDVRALLPAVRIPALVLNRTGDPIGPPAAGRYMAERMVNARFRELPGDDHVMWLGDVGVLCAEIEEFITGLRSGSQHGETVRAILQTDIEGSTALAHDLGDERWADLLERYGQLAGIAVAAQDGRIIDCTGDGLMAAFAGPVAAIRAAQRLQREVLDLGIRLRAGVHIGDVLERDGALRGIAVHVAARVMAEAKGGEIFVSETAKDIAAGARVAFHDRGVYTLKGVEGPRRLFCVI
jgi:class 3 adenylate cyclase